MVRRRHLLVALAVVPLSLGCPSDNKVILGVVLPLSGQAEIYGQSIQRGIELAFAEVEGDPAYPYEVTMISKDSKGDPNTAAQQLEELFDAGAIAAIGGVTSDEAQAMVEVADRRDRVLLSPSASSPELTAISRNFFRIFPSDFVEGTKMGQVAKQKLNLSTMVVLATSAPYGQGIQGVFANEFARQQGTIEETLEFPPSTSDVSGLVERVTTLDPDGVYLAGYWEELCTLIKGLRAGGYQKRILTTSAFATQQAFECAGEQANGVLFTQTVFELNSESDMIRSFVGAYRSRYGNEDPDLYAAHGYDAMRIMLDAIQRGGPLPSDFQKSLLNLQGNPFTGVTGSIQFDEKGDVQKYPRVYVVADGKAADYDREIDKQRNAIRERLRDLEEKQRRLAQGL